MTALGKWLFPEVDKLAFWVALLVSTAASSVYGLPQDVPPPKPKPKTEDSVPKTPAQASPSSRVSVAATLLVTCDVACNWKLDGEAKGEIEADGASKSRTELGQHTITAIAKDSPDRLVRDIDLKTNGQTVIHMELVPVRDARLRLETQREQKEKELEEAAQRKQKEVEIAAVTWADRSTGLMWTEKDNGHDVDWQQALSYCQNLGLAGYHDWHLPSIDELQGVYSKGHFHLSAAYWSSSTGETTEKAWYMLSNGTKYTSTPTIALFA
jgi:Protein of unknown function (DUF1566)